MGGTGSSRWKSTITRTSTKGLLRLDVRALARAGGVLPGAVATIAWGPMASVATEIAHDDPSAVTLLFRIRTLHAGWRMIRERVPLVWTPCTFGGSRVWFACPGCGERTAVLYALGGAFRCRACHRLAYASTRKNT